MTRPIKITLISIGGIIAVVLVAVAVVVNFVFSKEKLTPWLQEQVPSYVSCPTQFDEVELTFFSTFPDFALHVRNICMTNPKEGAQSDTLLRLDNLYVMLDAMAFLKHDNVDVKKVRLEQGVANLYVAADSTTNFDVLISSDEEQQKSQLKIDAIDLHDVLLDHLTFSYLDLVAGRSACMQDLTATITGESRLQAMTGKVDLSCQAACLEYADSLSTLTVYDYQLPACEVQLYDSTSLELKMTSAVDSAIFRLKGDAPMEIASGHLDVHDVAVSIKQKQLNNAGLSILLDTFSMTMQGADPMHLALSRMEVQVPQSSLMNDSLIADVKTQIAAINLKTRKDGSLCQDLPVRVDSHIATNGDFTKVRVTDSKVVAAGEELSFNIDMDRLDSLTLHLNSDFTLKPTTFSRLLALVPKSYRSALNGQQIKGNLGEVTAKAQAMIELGKQPDIESLTLKTAITNLDYRQQSQLAAKAHSIGFEARYPVENVRLAAQKQQQQAKRQQATQNKRRSTKAASASFLQATLVGNAFHVEMHDSTDIVADVPNANVNLTLSDEMLLDPQSLPFLSAEFSLDQLNALADTVALKAHQMNGTLTMADGMKGMKKFFEAYFESDDADIQMGKMAHVQSGPLNIEASSVYDQEQQDLLLKYNPLLNVTLDNGKIKLSNAPYAFEIPAIDFDFNLGRFQIRESQLHYGNSDFRLTGEILNLREYLNKESNLVARLNLNSKQTDVYQLMDLVELLNDEVGAEMATSGDASAQDGQQTKENASAAADNAEPFMVPRAIDLVLNTDITKTIVGENEFNNLGGKMEIFDGSLILEEMGFSSKAARMQLTAIYRSPQKNNLFLGANFHLLDIDVADLIRMIPQIDTIVPMLRSFEGKGEFHLGCETNLYGNYDLKMSTLKATASIEGKDLVLLDGETFSTISKYLMFNKKTRNQIDTLSVELAVNRRKMTLYPMLIGMDKYQAVISGNHDLTGDMPFNYHISVTDCPLVGGHIGLDIAGDLQQTDDISFKVVGCKYASLFKPEKRNITQEQTLELKQLISKSLKDTVRIQ